MKSLVSKLAEIIKENPVVVIITWLIGVLALVLAIAIPWYQAKKVRLSYSLVSTLLVTDSLSEIDGLDIKYNGNTIDQLTVTTCELCNTGNVTIEDSDVYNGHKIRIYTTSDSADILFAKVVSQSFDTNNCRVSYDHNSVTVLFDTLEKSEKAVINIYHTGKEDTVFSIDGKIKEGKILARVKSADYYSILTSGVALFSLLLSIFGGNKEDESAKNKLSSKIILSLRIILSIVCLFAIVALILSMFPALNSFLASPAV